MIVKTTAAWELIRAADPMASVDVSGASDGPAARELLHRITADAPSVWAHDDVDPPFLPVLQPSPGRGVKPERGVRTGLAAAAVVTLAVAAVAVAAARREHRTVALSPDRQTTAAGYGKALLARVPLPTGAGRVAAPPIPELKQSPSPGTGILDTRAAWWTVPGSFTAAVATFNGAGLPGHWRVSASGMAPRRQGWVIEVRDPRARFVSSVDVTIAAHGKTVGMLAQIDTHAVAVRTPAQLITASAESATFTFTGGGSGGYSSRLTLTISGHRITTLAHQINATPTFVMLTVGLCPPPAGRVAVTFRSGSQRWSLTDIDAGFACDTPRLTGSDGTSVTLTPSTALLTDVLTAAGLPKDYFRR